jgi:hypothetical protein
MVTAKMFMLVSASALLTAISIVSVAQTASNSPFASKKPKAWEQQPQQAPQYTPPASYPVQDPAVAPAWQNWETQPSQYAVPQQPAPQYQAPQYQAPQYQAPAAKASPAQPQYAAPSSSYSPQPQSATRQSGGTYYPGKPKTQAAPPYTPNYEAQNYQQPVQQQQRAQNYGQYAQQQAPQSYGQPSGLRGSSKPGWEQKLGFGNVETSLDGHAKFGIAAMDRTNDDVTAEVVADIDVRGEVSAITEGGLEYGAGLRVRAQRDRHRRGFGGRVGDCPAGDPACTNVVVDGTSRSVKGHTSQFYTSGPEDTRESQFALEGAYLFLRSAYGDIVLGRDDGAAYLFSLGAPSLVAVNASNSTIDYTGLDSVKTVNDASGFSEKITYTTPRLLGDTVGVGVQAGISYALDATACGVDYCVKDNLTGLNEPFAPEIEDVIEVALALDRTFDNGFSAELTGTYARGSEKTNNAVFDDLQAYGAGLELKYGDWIFGSSFLNSNNGFAGQGDYNAYDAGLTWKPNNWGFTASYGHADDDIAHLTSDQGVLAVSYDVGQYRLGTGLQYVNRNVPSLTPTGRIREKEEAFALFIEAGVKF